MILIFMLKIIVIGAMKKKIIILEKNGLKNILILFIRIKMMKKIKMEMMKYFFLKKIKLMI